MKKVLLAGLATAAFALGGPSVAHADYVVVVGGCSFAAASAGGSGNMTGEIDIEAVVYSDAPLGNPVNAIIMCYVTVNDVVAPGARLSASGTSAIIGAGVISYTSASASDDIQLCQDVSAHTASGSFQSSSECFGATGFEIPPPIVYEVGDPALCSALSIVRGVPGLVEVDETGDVYVLWSQVYDCPPYTGSGIADSGGVVHAYRQAHAG